jgi:uncharacterized small protein (DUF1192 family)
MEFESVFELSVFVGELAERIALLERQVELLRPWDKD